MGLKGVVEEGRRTRVRVRQKLEWKLEVGPWKLVHRSWIQSSRLMERWNQPVSSRQSRGGLSLSLRTSQQIPSEPPRAKIRILVTEGNAEKMSMKDMQDDCQLRRGMSNLNITFPILESQRVRIVLNYDWCTMQQYCGSFLNDYVIS